MRPGRRVLLRQLCCRSLQPRTLCGRRHGLPARRGLLLVSLSAERRRSAGLCVGLGVRKRWPRLQPGRRVLRPWLRQQRHLWWRPLCGGQGCLHHFQRLLLWRVRRGEVRRPGTRMSRGRRDLRWRSRMLCRPMRRGRGGHACLRSSRWVQGGWRNLQQWHGLLCGAVPTGAFRHRDLQGLTRLQGGRRALSRRERLLLGHLWQRRALPGGGRLLSQGRALPIQRRLLLGRVPKRSGGRPPLRGQARLQVHRRGMQEDRRVLREHGHLRCERALYGWRCVPKGGALVLLGPRLLFGRLCTEPLGQARVSRGLCARRRALHCRRGLLLGYVRWLPSALSSDT